MYFRLGSLLCFLLVILFSDSVSAQWIQTSSGIDRWDIRAVAISGSNVYAGTNLYGVYRSADNGATWSQSALNNRTVYSLAVSGQKIFAGTSLYGLYISADNGASWSQTSLATQIVSAVYVNGATVFAGTNEEFTFRQMKVQAGPKVP